MRKAILVVALLAIPLAPAAGVRAAACAPPIQSATALPEGIYFNSFANEIWQEDNGFPGLQIRAYGCDDGTTVPPDQCISRCPLGYALRFTA